MNSRFYFMKKLVGNSRIEKNSNLLNKLRRFPELDFWGNFEWIVEFLAFGNSNCDS